MNITRSQAEWMIKRLPPAQVAVIRAQLGPKPKPQAGQMRSTEKRFAEVLEGLRLEGKIFRWEFEHKAIQNPERMVRYMPDFSVWQYPARPDSLPTIHYEIKARWSDGSIGRWGQTSIRIRAVAGAYSWLKFIRAVWDGRKKEWDYKRFIPGMGWRKCEVLG